VIFNADKNKSVDNKPSAADATPAAAAARLRPSASDYIAGETDKFVGQLSPYLPHDLVGGSVPHVPGAEEESVWNAAAQACSTERVNYCYSIEGKRIWYLACPSASVASNPNSWCPLAAALPGRSEYWDRETVYLYEQEGTASALRWDPDTGRMQVFLGAARTLLPRIQSMDANFVTINAEVAEVVPWRNRAMRTEKLSRASSNALLYAGLLLNAVILLFLLGQYFLTGLTQRDLSSVKLQSERAANDLMVNAYNALQSDTIRHMVRVQELLDALSSIDGTLLKYQVEKGNMEWVALVPPSFKECTGGLKGCTVLGLEKDGRIRISGKK
jgi:hypothetical protein